MADYWKSQPRKFCQYCKCWIADNKPSIEFHERGKNHKENVAAKIAEIKKKSIDKAKQEARMSKQFAAMEEAAQKAYEEDLKRMHAESLGLVLPSKTTARPPFQPQPRPQVRQQPKKKPPKKPKKASRKPTQQREMELWVEGQTDDGQTYYYNTVTGESQWEKPPDLQGESVASEETVQAESSSGCAWMEAVSPDGYTYYYNTETGESSWEKPADFPLGEESGSSKEGENLEEPSTAEPEPISEGESSSTITPQAQETEVSEQASEEPKVPKISFRKRKAETELSEEEEGKASDDAPGEAAEEKKVEEEVPSTAAEPEKKEEAAAPPPVKTQAKRQKSVNPYGVWEKIQQEVDPYAKVDLQLPQVEGSTTSASADLPPEPKPKFKERIITSLGQESGPASFRKNKTQNGKSRRLRQRDDDD